MDPKPILHDVNATERPVVKVAIVLPLRNQEKSLETKGK